MTKNLGALATLWADTTQITGTTTVQKLAQVNQLRVPGPAVDVPIAVLASAVGASGLLQQFVNYAFSPPEAANTTGVQAAKYLIAALFNTFETGITSVPTSNADTLAQIQTYMNALVSDSAYSGVTQEFSNALMTFVQPHVPWYQANGWDAPVSVLDLINAGNLS